MITKEMVKEIMSATNQELISEGEDYLEYDNAFGHECIEFEFENGILIRVGS